MVEEVNPFYKKKKILRQMSKRVPSYTMTRDGVFIDTNKHDFLESVAKMSNVKEINLTD